MILKDLVKEVKELKNFVETQVKSAGFNYYLNWKATISKKWGKWPTQVQVTFDSNLNKENPLNIEEYITVSSPTIRNLVENFTKNKREYFTYCIECSNCRKEYKEMFENFPFYFIDQKKKNLFKGFKGLKVDQLNPCPARKLWNGWDIDLSSGSWSLRFWLVPREDADPQEVFHFFINEFALRAEKAFYVEVQKAFLEKEYEHEFSSQNLYRPDFLMSPSISEEERDEKNKQRKKKRRTIKIDKASAFPSPSP